MKFEHVTAGEVDVEWIIFDSEPLQDRHCGKCGSERFFAVEVYSDDKRVHRHSAICEGCKRIVELQ